MPARPTLIAVLLGTVFALGCAGHHQEHARVYDRAAVAADHAVASRAGADILRQGGNAVDAAVAASFALSVVRPYSCGIGGGGFMVIHLNNDPRCGTLSTAINYRETAPASARPDMFEGDPDPESSVYGGKAVAIPGNVAGLLYTLDKYGTLDRRTVLAPAIRAAREGFTVDAHYIDSVKDIFDWLANQAPQQQARSKERFAFIWKRYLLDGNVKVGDRIIIPEQAEVLQRIADHGADGFYRGPVAEAILNAVNRDGGRMTPEDLAGYRVGETQPLHVSCELGGRSWNILTMPPPSSGGLAVAQVFAMIDDRDDLVSRCTPGSSAWLHLMAEASQHAFADRARYLADPAFAPVPTERLLDRAYLGGRAATIDPARTFAPDHYGLPAAAPRDAGTSHISVVDANGSAVACSETVNLIFGSQVVAEPYGFVLNDEMDDFTTRANAGNEFNLTQSDENRPETGKRPLSCMSPMIAIGRDGRAELVAGGSGGPRIITATIQSALNVMVWDMTAAQAVAAPRLHHQWLPDILQLEPGVPDQVAADLSARGHEVHRRKVIGNVQLIRRAGNTWQAASDPRKGGVPDGF